MRKEFHWIEGGCALKTKEFSARAGSEILANLADVPPEVLLSETYVCDSKRKWHRLNSVAAINEHLVDVCGIYAPRVLLTVVSEMVMDRNFGFLTDWKAVRVPARFQLSDTAKTVQSAAMDPLLALLVNENRATMRELEEYYSFKDAYGMADMITANAVNSMLAREAAEAEAKRNKR